MRGLFITGTDTGVGKTYVTCAIACALREAGVHVGAYKPVCSGAVFAEDGQAHWEDVEALWEATARQFPPDRISPQCYRAPLAPPVAAREEGKRVDPDLLRTGIEWWREQVEVLLIEGAGGLLAPISDSDTVADLAVDLGCPVLIVAADRLGMLNQTLLTVEAAESRGLRVAGVVINRTTAESDASTGSNLAELERWCGPPVVSVVEYGGAVVLRPGTDGDRMGWQGLADEVSGTRSVQGDGHGV